MQQDHNEDRTRSVQAIGAGTTFGHYVITKRLGAGGMGEVYLADDTTLHRQVALKFLPAALAEDSNLKARFMREAQAAARLNHPNIVTVYEVGEHLGRPYIAMEHVDGHTLHYHAHEKPAPVAQVLALVMQVAEGLAKAHQQGIVHRDIKCANIIMDSDGRARILDFGLASVQDVDRLTRSGTTVGTVAYMSPEQVRGEEVDHRSDVYSLGIVLYELIAGRTPFKRGTEAATLHAILGEEPEPLSRFKASIPAELQHVIDKALDKDKTTRYQSAMDFCADIRRVQKSLDSKPVTAIAAETTPVVSRRTPLGRFVVPGFVVVALLVTALVLKPWKFEIGATQEAVAAEERLAVMYFDNVADPQDSERLGEIITNLAITGLSETKSLQVVSSQRLYDILKQLGREGEKRIDREVASQIAERAGASKMLIGSVLQTEPRLVVTAQIIDVASGGVLSSQRITGEPSDDVFALVDRLTKEVGEDLSIQAPASVPGATSVADVTTHSPEAYRTFLEGDELFQKLYLVEAKKKFLEAAELDSTFVKAYLALARDNQDSRRMAYIEKAMAHRDRATDRDRRLVEALNDQIHGDFESYYRRMTDLCTDYPDDKQLPFALASNCYSYGRLEDALTYLMRSIELDPLYKTAYNVLAYVRIELGDTAEAFTAVERYASIAPHEPNPYDTRGDLYCYIGQPERAIESYKFALQKAPEFFLTRIKLGDLYLFYGHLDSAQSIWQPLHNSEERAHRVAGRAGKTFFQVFTGQLSEAERSALAGLRQDTVEQGFGPNHGFKMYLRCITAFRSGRFEDAARQARMIEQKLVEQNSPAFTHVAHFLVETMMRAGRAEDAERILSELKPRTSPDDESAYAYYLVAVGKMQMARNDRSAISSIEQALDTADNHWFLGPYTLGQAYLQFGQPEKAVRAFERISRFYDEHWSGDAPASSDYHYYLAKAYEKVGDPDQALVSYDRYLGIMKDADPGIAEVADARARSQALRSKS